MHFNMLELGYQKLAWFPLGINNNYSAFKKSNYIEHVCRGILYIIIIPSYISFGFKDVVV